jgi:hypothetical protein
LRDSVSTHRRRANRLRFAIASFAVVLTLAAGTPTRAADDDEESKPHAEIEVKLPPPPKPESLLEFKPSAASSNQFFIDALSITIDSDETVRYTLVIRSPSGVDNVSYEGIRCDTVEQKYYAYGRRDGSWTKAQSGAWRRIRYQEVSRQHGVLYKDYFCPDGSPIASVNEAINRFKYGVPYGAPPRSGNRR